MDFTLPTGSGFWNPIAWLIAFIVSLLIVYIIRSFGRRDYKKDTEQVKPFLSGNVEEPDKLMLKSENLYWGFKESMKGYYQMMKKLHTGDLRDYVLWFIIVIILLFVVVEVI